MSVNFISNELNQLINNVASSQDRTRAVAGYIWDVAEARD